MKKVAVCFLCIVLLAWTLSGCGGGANEKPVIYLYPEEEMEVTVKLDFDGTLTSTYPAYEDGWTMTAQPDGTLTIEEQELKPVERNGFTVVEWGGTEVR